jgi:hypothetical protein
MPGRTERLRYRIARRLVGPFVTLPDKDGVWIVHRWVGDFSVVYEADKFRLKMCSDLPSLNEYDDLPTPSTRGRFAGTVKVR